MHEHIVQLRAPQNRRLHLWFEPWAEGLAFPPNSEIELHGKSLLPGKLELDETDERTAVYGWPGSALNVSFDGNIIQSFDQAAPDVLSRLSTKESISLLFGPSPMPTMEEGAVAQKNARWRFWK